MNRQGTKYFILMTLKKKARKAIKSKIREIIRDGGASPTKEIIAEINEAVAGWVSYFRIRLKFWGMSKFFKMLDSYKKFH